jgi:hypothetical protein
LRQRDRHHSQQFTVTAAKLASFITSVEAQEALLSQRKRDYEARAVFALMEGRQAPAGEISAPQSVIHKGTKAEAASATPSSTSSGTAPDGSVDDDIYEDF